MTALSFPVSTCGYFFHEYCLDGYNGFYQKKCLKDYLKALVSKKAKCKTCVIGPLYVYRYAIYIYTSLGNCHFLQKNENSSNNFSAKNIFMK